MFVCIPIPPIAVGVGYMVLIYLLLHAISATDINSLYTAGHVRTVALSELCSFAYCV